jgi:alkylhydroperoxidase family enzyme
MVRWFLRRLLALAARIYDEPLDPLGSILEASPWAFVRFVRLIRGSMAGGVLPRDVFHVVRVATANHEDCGACRQTTVDMARRDGVPVDWLAAVVQSRPERLPDGLAEVYHFVDRVLRGSGDEAEHRERIRARYAPHGDAVLADLAVVLSATRAIPVTKRVLGTHSACAAPIVPPPNPPRSPMTMSPLRERLALALLVVTTAIGLVRVPLGPLHAVTDPCHLAVAAGLLVTGGVVTARWMGERGVAMERLSLALFLAGMPPVYVSSWFWSPPPHGWAWLALELAAVPLYGALALAGYRRAPWALVAGIGLHGVGWDAWHYGRTPFVPDWYAWACLLADVGLAAYAATRVPHWQRAQQRRAEAQRATTGWLTTEPSP